MGTTIKQVAELGGVSVSTASHILCGRDGRYKAQTRDKVLRAADELKYRPNASAQAIKSGRFNTLALVLSDDPGRSSLFNELALGVSAELKERNQHLSLCVLSDQELTNTVFIPSFLRKWHVDGLLIAYFKEIPDLFVELIETHNIPSVWINSMNKKNCVFPDDVQAGRKATEYLLDLGHRNIAYVDYTVINEQVLLSRYGGYQLCMQAAGLTSQQLGGDEYIPRKKRIEFSMNWLALPDRPTAVVASSASTAMPLYHAACSLGLSIPEDLSIITFSNNVLDITGVHFTSMIVPFHQIGRKAVSMLLDKVEDKDLETPSVKMPFKLLEGQTCAPRTEPRAQGGL